MKKNLSFFLTIVILTAACRRDPAIVDPMGITDLPFENKDIRIELASTTIPVLPNITDMHFVDETTGFIISYDGRVYKTIDKGKTWTLKFGDPTLAQHLYKVLFTDTKVGYVAGGSTAKGFILKTSDGGETWATTYEVNGYIQFNGIVKNSSGDLFVTQLGGSSGNFVTTILKSVDAGANWSTTASLKEHVLDVTFSDGRGFCTGANGYGNVTIIRSDDNGNNWTHRTSFAGHSYRIAFKGLTGYCLTDYSTLYQTTDHGENWIQTYPSANYNLSILDPLTPNICLVWGSGKYMESEMGNHYRYGGVRMTTNAGRDWTDLQLKELSEVRYTSFYSSTEGYILSEGYTLPDKLMKVTVK